MNETLRCASSACPEPALPERGYCQKHLSEIPVFDG